MTAEMDRREPIDRYFLVPPRLRARWLLDDLRPYLDYPEARAEYEQARRASVRPRPKHEQVNR